MSVLVTGSIAYDHIMVFQDRFKNHILPDKIHVLNVSFTVPSLDRRWGGTGANIAYNLRILDIDPILLATAGRDFSPYGDWMARHGIRLDWIRVLEDSLTSQCFITTDLDDNQITAFHPGAMERAHEAPLSGVGEEFRVGIVAPNGKRAMLEHAQAFKERETPCVIDPGQALPMFDRKELLSLLDGAAVYVVNDYEWAVTLERTGLDEDALARRVAAIVVTRGEQGCMLREGDRRLELPAVRAERVVDPTGCGDAFRAGILYAMARDLSLEMGARIGSLLGALKVAQPGPQSIELDFEAFRALFEGEFGQALG
ncbi:MAG: carbohydrate kinase family protein [Myxococcota bacterium]